MTSQAAEHVKATIARNIDLAITSKPGLTNRAVGAAIGATEHMVWRWRRGRVEPTTHYLVALAAVLDKEVAWFYSDHEEVEA
jgi:transcriptional regulator with XRE-family HTH domain